MLKPDARVLGQILAAQNILFALPTTKSVAEFYANALATLPGVRYCRVCLADAAAEEGVPPGDPCAACPAAPRPEARPEAGPRASECKLTGAPDTSIFAVKTTDHHFGIFVVHLDQTELFEPYRAFIGNLASFVALSLENRLQSSLLRAHRDELERRVAERTQQLGSLNETLRRSEQRKSILNEIAGVFLTEPGDEMYNRVLDIVRRVTQSELGIFGYVAENGDLVTPSLTAEVWDRCRVADKSLVFPAASWGQSAWGRAIRERRTFCTDGPFHTPPGHIRVEHFLAVPVVLRDETIGVLSVARNERSYTPVERELVESIAGSIAPVLHARLRHDWQEEKRKRAEDTLRKLSRAVEQSPISIMVTDTAGTIEYVNPKFTEVTGYTLAEAVGQNPRILKTGATPPEEYRRLWQTITSGKDWRGEFQNRKKSGELYWERASISPIFDSDGKITHFLAVKEDITERRRLEAELRQAQKLEAVGQLAGGVAHDFNNILAAVIMQLNELQEMPGLNAEMTAGLQELERGAQRAASLTRQLLLFSRRQKADTLPLDLTEVVSNLAKMLRRLIGEDIELVLQAEGGGLWVNADAGMMEQVLMNLCVNARDAMPEGGRLTVDIRRVQIEADAPALGAEARPGAFVCLVVTDTGCGMDEETQRHIFEPFFTTKAVGRGTGLGLATVYGIVKQHHGWVELSSAPEKGTTFRVYLPMLERAASPGLRSGAIAGPGGSECVLVVEDDRSVRRLVASRLRMLGYMVLEAADGAEAMKLWELHRQRIDLLFTDMVMPGGLTGQALAERLLKEAPALKVILSSGYNAERSRPERLADRGITYLPKPYDATLLAQTVRQCLDQRRG